MIHITEYHISNANEQITVSSNMDALHKQKKAKNISSHFVHIKFKNKHHLIILFWGYTDR